MSLRTRILLFLFSFALIPLVVAVVLNLPLVLDRVELFYRHAILQDLRADFRDLDQHLVSREAVVQLLAKLPEPGAASYAQPSKGEAGDQEHQVDLARVRYTEWINHILRDQPDIVQLSFVDAEGVARFWLERDPRSGTLEPTRHPPHLPPSKVLVAALSTDRPVVLLTPVRVDAKATHPSRVLNLQLVAPIFDREAKVLGAVSITLDIGGLVRRDPRTLWVLDDGRYLQAPGLPARDGDAFRDFPGLDGLFRKKKTLLWEGSGGRQVIWVPLLRTEDDRPLWVGRPVNREPLIQFELALIERVLVVVLVLVVAIWLLSRWFAQRAERLGRELTEGIRRLLEGDESVVFSWRGSPELRQLGEDLTRLAQTHARNSRNLRAHARELEASNRYKSEFLANVSHELRTPLNSILLLSKLLTEDPGDLSVERRQQLRVIHEAARDLRALIDDILDLSRIEAGRMTLHLDEVDLGQLLEDLVALLDPQFRDKGVALRLEMDAAAPRRLWTDVDKLRQILKNFLANALKFTAEGEVVLGLSPAEPPFAVEIWVRDSGIGIPREKQEAIFEAFTQADGSTSRRYGGTGLGLTISRQLAALLGGEIRLRSAPGEGARFGLLLPAEHEGGGQTEVPARPPSRPAAVADQRPAEALPEADFGGHRVLLVDDDLQTLLALTPLLERWGMEVLAAADGEEALETLEEYPCDLVLVDTRMSLGDPCATIENMREQCRKRASRVAIVALRRDAGDALCAEEVDAELVKPVEARRLHALLRGLLVDGQPAY